MRIEPDPTEEEASAIMAALEILREDGQQAPSVKRSRWRLAGLFGHPVPPEMNLEGLWSYRGWEG